MVSDTNFRAHLVSLWRARMRHMDSVIVVVALIAAAVGVALGYFWGRFSGTGGNRLAELEAQLAATRENAVRLGTQAAELERDAQRLQAQLLESERHGSTLEERTRQLQERLVEERAQKDKN